MPDPRPGDARLRLATLTDRARDIAARPRVRRGAAIALGGLAALILTIGATGALVLAALDEGRLDGAVMRFAADRLGRPVRFERLDAHLLAARPEVTITGLVVGNPAWAAKAPDLLQARRVHARFAWSSLLRGRRAPVVLEVDGAQVSLLRQDEDHETWRSGKGGGGDPLSGMRRLVVRDSRFRFEDRVQDLRLEGAATHDASADPRWPLRLQADGRVQGGAVRLIAQGGALNGRRRNAPYPMKAALQDGDMRLSAEGVLSKPFSFKGFDLAVRAQGPNLVALEYLLDLGTPNSTPFNLTGRIRREGEVTRATDLSGTLGDSRLTGSITSDGSGKRRLLTLDLTAETLHIRDIAAILAERPSHGVARVTPGAPGGGERLFSRKPLDLARFNKKDADIRLSARRFVTGPLAAGALTAKGQLRDGVFTLDAFQVAFPSGRLTARYGVDLRRPDIGMSLDARLSNARLSSLAPDLGETVDGQAGLRLKAQGSGRSIHQIVTRAQGEASLDLRQGRLQRATAKFLTGALVEGALNALVAKSATTDLTCAQADFAIGGGKAVAQRIVLVTDSGVTRGQGAIDLDAERLNLALYGERDGFALFKTKKPVVIEGPLTSPKVGLGDKPVDPAPADARAC